MLALYSAVRINHASQIFPTHNGAGTRAGRRRSCVCFAYLWYPNNRNERRRKEKKKEEEDRRRNSQNIRTAPKKERKR